MLIDFEPAYRVMLFKSNFKKTFELTREEMENIRISISETYTQNWLIYLIEHDIDFCFIPDKVYIGSNNEEELLRIYLLI